MNPRKRKDVNPDTSDSDDSPGRKGEREEDKFARMFYRTGFKALPPRYGIPGESCRLDPAEMGTKAVRGFIIELVSASFPPYT